MHNSGLSYLPYRIVSYRMDRLVVPRYCTVPGRGLDRVAPIPEFHLYALFIYAYQVHTVFLWVFLSSHLSFILTALSPF